MGFDYLEFSRSWTKEADFPTYEPDEKQVRQDLQFLHEETKNAFNRLIGLLNQQNAAKELPFASEELQAKNVLDAIEEVYEQAKQSSAGAVLDRTIGKAKLTAELLERVYGGRVWVSADEPGAAQNPDSDFPVGQLWLRPGYRLDNLAAQNWAVTGGTSKTEDAQWLLVADGTLSYLAASQTMNGLGQEGDQVYLVVEPLELDAHLSSLELKVGETTVDLKAGGGVVEAALGVGGSLTVEIRGDWPYTEPEAVLRLRRPVLVNATRVEESLPGCKGPADWPGHLAALGVFDTAELPRILFLQTAPGQWIPVDQQVLPADRGGTGQGKVGTGELLCSGDGGWQLLAPGSSGTFLRMAGGRPVWETADQAAGSAGFLRLKTGSYTGTGTSRTVELGFAPKLLCVYPDSGPDTSGTFFGNQPSDNPFVLGNGATQAGVFGHTDNGTTYYTASVRLSGSQLIFSGRYGAKLGNRSGVSYTWAAIY